MREQHGAAVLAGIPPQGVDHLGHHGVEPVQHLRAARPAGHRGVQRAGDPLPDGQLIGAGRVVVAEHLQVAGVDLAQSVPHLDRQPAGGGQRLGGELRAGLVGGVDRVDPVVGQGGRQRGRLFDPEVGQAGPGNAGVQQAQHVRRGLPVADQQQPHQDHSPRTQRRTRSVAIGVGLPGREVRRRNVRPLDPRVRPQPAEQRRPADQRGQHVRHRRFGQVAVGVHQEDVLTQLRPGRPGFQPGQVDPPGGELGQHGQQRPRVIPHRQHQRGAVVAGRRRRLARAVAAARTW